MRVENFLPKLSSGTNSSQPSSGDPLQRLVQFVGLMATLLARCRACPDDSKDAGLLALKRLLVPTGAERKKPSRELRHDAAGLVCRELGLEPGDPPDPSDEAASKAYPGICERYTAIRNALRDDMAADEFAAEFGLPDTAEMARNLPLGVRWRLRAVAIAMAAKFDTAYWKLFFHGLVPSADESEFMIALAFPADVHGALSKATPLDIASWPIYREAVVVVAGISTDRKSDLFRRAVAFVKHGCGGAHPARPETGDSLTLADKQKLWCNASWLARKLGPEGQKVFPRMGALTTDVAGVEATQLEVLVEGLKPSTASGCDLLQQAPAVAAGYFGHAAWGEAMEFVFGGCELDDTRARRLTESATSDSRRLADPPLTVPEEATDTRRPVSALPVDTDRSPGPEAVADSTHQPGPVRMWRMKPMDWVLIGSVLLFALLAVVVVLVHRHGGFTAKVRTDGGDTSSKAAPKQLTPLEEKIQRWESELGLKIKGKDPSNEEYRVADELMTLKAGPLGRFWRKTSAGRPAYVITQAKAFRGADDDTPERKAHLIIAYVKLHYDLKTLRELNNSHAAEWHNFKRLVHLNDRWGLGIFDEEPTQQHRGLDLSVVFVDLGRHPYDPSKPAMEYNFTAKEYHEVWTRAVSFAKMQKD